MKDIPVLVKNIAECCGCSACFNICPVGAISLPEDREGFEYPEIDAELCIRCRKCVSVCCMQ